MKLVLHIVAKDLRKLRWPLALWLLVVALNLGVGFALVGTGGFLHLNGDHLMDLIISLRIAAGVLTFVITAMLVQEDTLVGSTPFWITRPISNWRLLGAKFAGWFLLLVLPQLILSLPWWITCGFGVKHIALAAIEVIAWQALAALPAALVASLTDTLSRFLVWAFVLLFGLVAGPASFVFWVTGTGRLGLGGEALPIFIWAGWVAFGVVVVRVIVNQFLRRDVTRSVAMLGAGVVLAMLIAVLAPIGLSRVAVAWSKPTWTDWHAERAEGISLSVRPFRTRAWGKPTNNVWLYANLEVKGLPKDLTIGGGTRAQQTWRWPDGYTLTRESAWVNAGENGQALRSLLGMAEQKRDEETNRYWAKRSEEQEAKRPLGQRSLRVQSLPPVRAGAEIVSEVLPTTPERMRRTPPSYEATVPLALLRLELWVDTPLAAGGWHAKNGYGFRPGRVTPGNRHWARDEDYEGVTFLDVEPTVFTEPAYGWETGYQSRWQEGDWRRAQLLVVNRTGGDMQWQFLPRYATATIASVGICYMGLNVWNPLVRRGDKWKTRDEHWLEGVSIVLVGAHEEARFTRTVKTERFETDVKP